jgi:hypothetical protein
MKYKRWLQLKNIDVYFKRCFNSAHALALLNFTGFKMDISIDVMMHGEMNWKTCDDEIKQNI